MKNKRKTFIRLAILIVFLGGLMLIGRFYVLTKIKDKLELQLHALRDSGYIITYDSIAVDTKRNTVKIYKLVIKREIDSTLCLTTNFFSAKRVEATGFEILPLLLKKKLSFKAIKLESPQISLYENFFSKQQNLNQDRREFSIAIENINLPNLSLSYFSSDSCKAQAAYTGNLAIENFTMLFSKKRTPIFDAGVIRTDSVKLELPSEFYSIKIKDIELNLTKGIFNLDTLRIIPHYNKITFGRKKKREIDRIEGTIPYLNIYGLNVLRNDTFGITGLKLTTQLFLKIFRDKRLPFKNELKPLPIELLYSLPFGLIIDSLIVNKSYIQYEEFAEEADSSGLVFFDETYATIKNINNTDLERKGKSILKASSHFMGQGKLVVKAELPFDLHKKSKVSGYLRDMDFKKLNMMIEPQIKMRAESGHLNNLVFQFDYTNDESNGELELDYNNLKMLSFRSEDKINRIREKKSGKEKNSESDSDVEIHPLKTFLINTFILKKNMDKSIPEEKRKGTIQFVRDKRRSIFNYWAKSMFSGIKSAFNVDKLESRGAKKLLDKKKK